MTTTPEPRIAELRTAAEHLLRADAPAFLGEVVPVPGAALVGLGQPLAAWLDRAAMGWESLIYAADTVLTDASDPKQVESRTALHNGPYDAAEALVFARAVNLAVSRG